MANAKVNVYGKDVFKSVSDERLVIDVVAPGFSKDSVTVKTAKVNGGENFKVVVEGTVKARTNKKGEKVPALAFDKYLENFKYSFSDNTEFANDDLFRGKETPFVSKDYDLDDLKWSVDNGVIRISIPKTKLARGVEVQPVANADADSTGVVVSDAVEETGAADE